MYVTDASKSLYNLKLLIKNSCWVYLRSVKHFQLYSTVLLNRTAFSFEVSVVVRKFI